MLVIWTRRDGAVSVELHGKALQKEFGVTSMISRGTGVDVSFDGFFQDEGHLVLLRRAGRKIAVIQRSERVVRTPSPGAAGIGQAREQGDVVVAVLPVLSESETRAVLVDPIRGGSATRTPGPKH